MCKYYAASLANFKLNSLTAGMTFYYGNTSNGPTRDGQTRTPAADGVSQ